MMKKKKQQGLERLRAEHHRFQHEISHIRFPSCSEHQRHRSSSSNSSTDNNDGNDAVWDSIESLKQVCKESNKTAAAAASNLVETWDCSPHSVEVSCQATETECSTGGKIRITATTLFTANKGHLFVDGNAGSTPKATIDIPQVTSPTTEATPREAISNDNGVVHLPEGELVLASSALNIHIRDAGVSSSNPAHATESFSKPINSQNVSHLGNRSTRTAAATRRLTSKIKNILERLDKGATFQSPALEAFGGLRNESTGLAEAESYLQDVVSALSSGRRLNRQAVEDNPPQKQELFHSTSEGINGLNAPDAHNLQDIEPQLPTKELSKQVRGGEAFADANRMETVPEGGQLNTRLCSPEASVPEVPHNETEMRERRTESPVVKSKEAQYSLQVATNDTLSSRCTYANKEAQCSLQVVTNDTLSGRCTNASKEAQCSLQVVANDTSSDRCTNASKDVQCSLQADAAVDSQNDNASKGARSDFAGKYVPDTKLKGVKPSFPLNFKCKANMEGQGDYAEKLIKRRERENNEFLQRCREKVGQLLEGCRILEAGGENLNHVHIPFENREASHVKPMDLLHGPAPKGKKDKKLAIKHTASPPIDIHTMLRDEHTLSSKGHSVHTLKQKVNAPATSSGWQVLDVRLECAKSAVRNMAGGAFDYDQIYADLGALGDERMKIEQLEMSQRQHLPFSEKELQINQVITEEFLLGTPDRLDGKASQQKGAGGKRRRATRSPVREPGSKLLRSKLGKIQPILLDFDRNKDHFGSLLRSHKWDNTATSTQSKVKRPQQKSDRSALHEKKVPAWVERMTQKPKFDIFEQLEKEKPDKYSFLGALKRRSVRPPGSIFKVGKPINWLPESASDTKSMAGQGPMQKKKKMFSPADGQDKLKKEYEHRGYKSQARYFESSSMEGEKQRSQNDVYTGDFPSTSNTLNPFNASENKTTGGGRREHDIESGNGAQDTVLLGATKNFKAKGSKVATQKAINIQDSEGGKAGWVVVGDFCISELNRKGTQVKSGQSSQLLELPKTLPSPSDLPCTSHGSPFHRTRVEEPGSRTPVARIVQTVDPSSIAGPSERIHIEESCKKHLEDELLKRSLLEVLLKSILDESQAEVVDHFATEPVNRIRQDERPRPVTTSTQVNDNGPVLLYTRPALKERESSDVECQTQLLASTSEAGRYKQPPRRALTRTMAFKERESSDMESQTELLASNSETREDKQPSLELPTAESSQAVSDTPYVRRSPAAIQGTSRRQHPQGGQVSDGSNQRLGLLSLLPVPFPIMFPVHLNNLRTDHQSTVPVQASPSRVDCAIQTTGQLPQDTRISTGLDRGLQKEIQTAFEPSLSSSPTTPSTPISSPDHEAMIQAALAPLSTTVPSRSNVILLFSDSAGQGSRRTATSDVGVIPSKQLRKGKQHADIHRSNEGSEIELIQDIEERHLGSPKSSRDALHVEHIQPSAMKHSASGTDELLLDIRAREHPFPRTTLHMDDIQPASTSNFVLSGDGGERAGLVARDHALRQENLKLEDTQPTSTIATDVRRQPADISVKFKEERYSPGFDGRGYLAVEEMSQENLKLKEEDLVDSSRTLDIQELESDGEMKAVWGFEETEVLVGTRGSHPYGSPRKDSSSQTDGLVVLDSNIAAAKDLDRESKLEGTENTQYFSVEGEISREASDTAFMPSTSNNARKHFLADHSSRQIQDDGAGRLWHSRRLKLKMHLEHGPKGRYPVLFGKHVLSSKNIKMLAELERKAAAVLKGRDFRTLQTGRELREKEVHRSHISSEESAHYSTQSSTPSSDEVKFKGIQSRLILDSAEYTSSSDGACSSSGSYSNSLINLPEESRCRQLSEGEVELGLIEAEEISEGEASLSWLK